MKVYLARVLGPLASPAAWTKLTDLLTKDGKIPYLTAAAFSGLDHQEVAFKAAAGNKLKDKEFITWLDQGGSTAPAKKTAGELLKGDAAASFKRGKDLYNGEAACFSCHGPTGEGIPNLGPPLDGSEWVTGKPEIFGKILLHGLAGPITVAGKEYVTAAEMPALLINPNMTDERLADIMTYTRNEWSNKAAPVTADLFKKLREETKSQTGRPYTAKDLK
jgi:mono/diheme cytochrome c family protein